MKQTTAIGTVTACMDRGCRLRLSDMNEKAEAALLVNVNVNVNVNVGVDVDVDVDVNANKSVLL